MYFDQEIIKLSEAEVFVDCGGYEGDSTEDFIRYAHNKYEKVYLFEPDKCVLENAKKITSAYRNIVYMNMGVGERESQLCFFRGNSKGDGYITENGNERITVIDLDTALHGARPSYIKMDIEGSEMDALRGCHQILTRHRPRLAISIYHKAKDLFEIPFYVASLDLKYRFYIRHYTRSYADTVLYCIPDADVQAF